jgi:hypothetical protein
LWVFVLLSVDAVDLSLYLQSLLTWPGSGNLPGQLSGSYITSAAGVSPRIAPRGSNALGQHPMAKHRTR